jgi:hypothetical protein
MEKIYNAVYVRKFGKYELHHHINGEYCLTDGWVCDWFMLYPKDIGGGWVHDGKFQLRKDVREWFNKLSPKGETTWAK